MPPLPRITGRELVRALGKQGWLVVVQKGSHAQFKHPTRGGRVTVPLHAGETIGPEAVLPWVDDLEGLEMTLEVLGDTDAVARISESLAALGAVSLASTSPWFGRI